MKIKYGANFKVIGKNDAGKLSDPGAWKPVVGTIADLAAHIGKGHPFMPAVLDKGSRRVKEAANYAEILAVDIDGGMTIEQAIAHPFISAHACLGIESANSKVFHEKTNPDSHEKFRLVFRLPSPVTDHQVIDILNRYMQHLLGEADKACKDASRFYFGAPDREPFLLNEDAVLPDSFVDDALSWWAEKNTPKTASKPALKPVTGGDDDDLTDRLVEDALNAIPRRVAGGGTYDDYRRSSSALKGRYGEEKAIAMMEAHSPSAECGWDVAQVIRSSHGHDIGTLFWIAEHRFGWKRPKWARRDRRSIATVEVPQDAPKGMNWGIEPDQLKDSQEFTRAILSARKTEGKIEILSEGEEVKEFTPEQMCFELLNYWKGLPETELLQCTNALIEIGVEALDRLQQDRLWVALSKVTKLPKKTIEAQSKQAFFNSPQGQQKLAEMKAAQEQSKCDFLQVKQEIEEACGSDLRLNQLKFCLEFKGREINPGRYKTFVAELINRDVPREDCIEILGAIAEANAYHPVQEYLERVYAQYGDKTRHLLNDAGCRLFNPNANLDIYNTYLRKWMIGAVARIYEPGCKFDHVLVLQGTQDKFKSTILETLAGSDFFTDNLGDLANVKDDLLVLHSAWIHEWAEFDKVSGKREASVLKAFITRKEDRFRAPYDRAVIAHKRRSVLCGSVNENCFLVDDENRRFWVIPVDRPTDIETARAERDRLWAAAVSLFRSGELPILSGEEKQLNAELNKTYQREDVWEEPIERWLSQPANLYTSASNDGKLYFTMRELLEGIGVPVDRQGDKDLKRAKLILTRLGHTPVGKIRLRKGVESVSTRAWVCSATLERNASGTPAEQPNRIKASSNSCSAVPLESIEFSEVEKFSSNGHHTQPEEKKSADIADEVSGTAEPKRNNPEESRVLTRSANSCPSGTPAVSGTTLKVGDRTLTPDGEGEVLRIDGAEAVVMVGVKTTYYPIAQLQPIEGAIA